MEKRRSEEEQESSVHRALEENRVSVCKFTCCSELPFEPTIQKIDTFAAASTCTTIQISIQLFNSYLTNGKGGRNLLLMYFSCSKLLQATLYWSCQSSGQVARSSLGQKQHIHGSQLVWIMNLLKHQNPPHSILLCICMNPTFCPEVPQLSQLCSSISKPFVDPS